MEEVAISVNGISKSFKLPHEKNDSLKSAIIHPFKKRTYENQQVLKDISFEIKKGEFFGIVGRNGSGKSTLLKLLAGIYTPDKGIIQVNGKLTPFIELGVGFNPELSGRENVFLNGALLGFNRKEMEAMYEEIVAFAELEKFMDQKLKNYSSGMQVRLAFSIAIKAKSDILVLDEVLAVGDVAFQEKCREYFTKIKNAGHTVVLVTHDMNAVKEFCTQAMLISNGIIRLVGDQNKVSEAYDELNRSKEVVGEENNQDGGELVAEKKVIINGVKISSGFVQKNKKEKIKDIYIKHENNIEVGFQIEFEKDIKGAAFDFGLRLGGEGAYYFYSNSEKNKDYLNSKKGEKLTINYTIDNVYNKHILIAVASVYDPKTHEVFALNRNIGKLHTANGPFAGVVSPTHSYLIEE